MSTSKESQRFAEKGGVQEADLRKPFSAVNVLASPGFPKIYVT